MKFPKTNTQPSGSPGNDASRLAVSRAERANHCFHSTSDGRQCRMPRWEAHASLCLFHASQEQQLIDLDRVSTEFRSLPGVFKTDADLNSALARLLNLVAHGRIPPRSAATLAYIGHLLLRTLPGVRQENLAVTDLAAPSPIDRESSDAVG